MNKKLRKVWRSVTLNQRVAEGKASRATLTAIIELGFVTNVTRITGVSTTWNWWHGASKHVLFLQISILCPLPPLDYLNSLCLSPGIVFVATANCGKLIKIEVEEVFRGTVVHCIAREKAGDWWFFLSNCLTYGDQFVPFNNILGTRLLTLE